MPNLNSTENYQRAIRLASMKKRNNQNQQEEAAAGSAAPQEVQTLLGPTQAEISSAPLLKRQRLGRPKGNKAGHGRPKKQSELSPRDFRAPVKELEIPLKSFKRQIRQVQNTIEGAESFRYGPEASAALQYGVESFLSELLEEAQVYISALTKPRKTVTAKDLQYVYEFRKRR